MLIISFILNQRNILKNFNAPEKMEFSIHSLNILAISGESKLALKFITLTAISLCGVNFFRSRLLTSFLITLLSVGVKENVFVSLKNWNIFLYLDSFSIFLMYLMSDLIHPLHVRFVQYLMFQRCYKKRCLK